MNENIKLTANLDFKSYFHHKVLIFVLFGGVTNFDFHQDFNHVNNNVNQITNTAKVLEF